MKKSFLVFSPDRQYFDALVSRIIRVSGVPEDSISLVQINCGNGSGLGTVIKKNGERIQA
jgi:hypothetical protein